MGRKTQLQTPVGGKKGKAAAEKGMARKSAAHNAEGADFD
jgi:hypothetical protein